MKTDRETTIITIYLVVDALCEKFLTRPSQKQKLNDSEVITIAICSALFFSSNHDKALAWLHQGHYFLTPLSLSRYNRRVHRLKDFIEFSLEQVFELFLFHDIFIQDSMPLPLCKRARASRNKKVRGRQFYGYCSAKKEKFFGFRLHLVTNLKGIPVAMQILPAAYHDLTPIYETTFTLPKESTLLTDKAFNSQPIEATLLSFGITLMPLRKKNYKLQWSFFQERFISLKRRRIETSFSLLSDLFGLDRLKARTLNGFFLKVHSAALALVFHLLFLCD